MLKKKSFLKQKKIEVKKRKKEARIHSSGRVGQDNVTTSPEKKRTKASNNQKKRKMEVVRRGMIWWKHRHKKAIRFHIEHMWTRVVSQPQHDCTLNTPPVKLNWNMAPWGCKRGTCTQWIPFFNKILTDTPFALFVFSPSLYVRKNQNHTHHNKPAINEWEPWPRTPCFIQVRKKNHRANINTITNITERDFSWRPETACMKHFTHG